jgi:hypothetical protein
MSEFILYMIWSMCYDFIIFNLESSWEQNVAHMIIFIICVTYQWNRFCGGKKDGDMKKRQFYISEIYKYVTLNQRLKKQTCDYQYQ